MLNVCFMAERIGARYAPNFPLRGTKYRSCKFFCGNNSVTKTPGNLILNLIPAN